MKITDIKQQVKRADRYSIYVDNKYAFSLSEAELMAVNIKIGQEFSQAELQSLMQKAIIDKGYDRALNLIMRRPRSQWEITEYLKRKDYDEDSIANILNKLSNRGHIDDSDFARRWVESRRVLKPTSKRKLTLELRQKRVNDEVIQEVLVNEDADELEVLRDLVARKRRQTKYQDNTKLMQHLIRQGFSYGDVKHIMSETRE